MTKTSEIMRLNQEHPDWSSTQIAAAVGCLPEYVREVAKRKNLALSRKNHIETDPTKLRERSRKLLLKAENLLKRARESEGVEVGS